MASLNEAVMVTVSDPDRKLSTSLSVRVTLTLELHTPHSGCLEASFLQVELAILLKLLGSDPILFTHHPETSWLKRLAPLNISVISVTLDVFQLPIF